jgi:hypothetical protein
VWVHLEVQQAWVPWEQVGHQTCSRYLWINNEISWEIRCIPSAASMKLVWSPQLVTPHTFLRFPSWQLLLQYQSIAAPNQLLWNNEACGEDVELYHDK